MNPDRLLTIPCRVCRRMDTGEVDRGNTPVMVVDEYESTCWLQQDRADEDTVNADHQMDTWTLFLHAGTIISGGDYVIVEGDRYELTGPPWEAVNPRTRRVSHLECRAHRDDPALSDGVVS